MNITQENIDELNAVIKVKVNESDYETKVNNALKEYQKKASMPGFRPGKVPHGMIKKMYRKSVLVDEMNKLLSENLYQYLNENKIEVLGNPIPKADSDRDIDWDNQSEFEFLYEMGLSPKFNVDISKQDTFEYQTILIDEELISKTVSDIAKRYGKMEMVELSQADDFFSCDIVELDANKEVVPGGLFKTATVFTPRLTEATKALFVGKHKEDKIEVNAQDVTENSDNLALMLGIDKAAAAALNCTLRFTIKSISRMTEAELNQSLFDKLYGEGKINSADEFKEEVKKELMYSFMNEYDRKFYNTVVEYLMNKINFNLPTEFLKRYIHTVNEKPISIEQLDKEFGDYEKGLKWQLIENKIIKDNNISVTKEELMDYTKQLIMQQFGRMEQMPMNDDELNKTAERVLQNQEELKKINETLLGGKVMTLFKDKFNVVQKEVSYNQFYDIKK